jgi:hypothetical protein
VPAWIPAAIDATFHTLSLPLIAFHSTLRTISEYLVPVDEAYTYIRSKFLQMRTMLSPFVIVATQLRDLGVQAGTIVSGPLVSLIRGLVHVAGHLSRANSNIDQKLASPTVRGVINFVRRNVPLTSPEPEPAAGDDAVGDDGGDEDASPDTTLGDPMVTPLQSRHRGKHELKHRHSRE